MKFQLKRQDLLKFAYELYVKIRTYGNPIFLCVGSDKWVCDSLAPIVAETLKHEFNIDTFVYGGLDYNINANNLMEAVNYIETVHPSSTIILIDATFGKEAGTVVLKEGCFPGMGKYVPIKKIGTISILGTVGISKKIDLNSTRLKVVLELARFISTGCFLAMREYRQSKKDNTYSYSTIIN